MSIASYRYVEKKRRYEKKLNIHVKEMVEMIKSEEVKQHLYVKGIKLTNHALKRMTQYFGINNLSTATRKVKNMLSKAKRIGTVLSYDGRISVLYAFDKTAIYLSPNLKSVITVNKYCYEDNIYRPIERKIKEGCSEKKAVDLHWQYLNKIEEEEEKLTEKLLQIEKKVRNAVDSYQMILEIGRRSGDRKKTIKQMISHHNLELKREAWNLFNLKIKKKHICKSLVVFY